jgi:hypothetical protein
MDDEGRKLQRHYENNPVQFDQGEFIAWLEKLDETKLKALDGYNADKFQLFVADLRTTRMMVKDVTKPLMNDTNHDAVAKQQSISYHEKSTVAMWSPPILETDRRFNSVLKPNIYIGVYKNQKQMADHVRVYGPKVPGEKTVAAEIDQSKFDKSQQKAATNCEYFVMYKMGVDRDFLNWLARSCARTGINADAGIALFVAFQRKSGYSNTTPGNNKVNFFTLMDTMDLSVFYYIMLLGDDSVVSLPAVVDTSSVEANMALRYNLTVKMIVHDHEYFCSQFIVKSEDFVAIMPDPIKKLESLTKPINVRNVKDYEAAITALHTSFKDTMAPYQNLYALMLLNDCVVKHYEPVLKNGVNDYTEVLIALANVAQDREKFRKLFSEKPVFTEV